MKNQESTTFSFNKDEFYVAKHALPGESDLGVWCYLADGNIFDKRKIAKLNQVSERSVNRSLQKLSSLGYYIDGVFYATPRLDLVKDKPKEAEITKPEAEKEVKIEKKVEVLSSVNGLVSTRENVIVNLDNNKWINQF